MSFFCLLGLALSVASFLAAFGYRAWLDQKFISDPKKTPCCMQRKIQTFDDPFAMKKGTKLTPAHIDFILNGFEQDPRYKDRVRKLFIQTGKGEWIKR